MRQNIVNQNSVISKDFNGKRGIAYQGPNLQTKEALAVAGQLLNV